jgi:DUF4097 and DUF4098 domain-containing protein YvlB
MHTLLSVIVSAAAVLGPAATPLPHPPAHAAAAPAPQDAARERADRERAIQRERIDQQRAERERQRAERDRARQEAQRQAGAREEERTTRTLKIGANGELHLANISGDILVTRGGGSEAVVEIVKTARGRTSEEARDLLGLVTVEVVERGGRAEIRTHYPHGDELRRANRRHVNVEVSLTATVPPGTRVRANSISGSVTARDIKADVVLKSISGTVRVANGGGVSAAESISGNVEVTETNIEGIMTASSASGSIVLKRVKARQLELSSVSGSVVMEEVESPRVEAQTVSGDVRYGGPLAKNARYELSSHSGNVVVAVGGAGFEVEATSFSGDVRSDFPLGGDGQERMRRGTRTVRGVHGDGSAVLELTTFSGNIVITKR